MLVVSIIPPLIILLKAILYIALRSSSSDHTTMASMYNERHQYNSFVVSPVCDVAINPGLLWKSCAAPLIIVAVVQGTVNWTVSRTFMCICISAACCRQVTNESRYLLLGLCHFLIVTRRFSVKTSYLSRMDGAHTIFNVRCCQ